MDTIAKISPKMLNPRSIAGNAEEEEKMTASKKCNTGTHLDIYELL